MTTILITGASSGLGAQMARQFAARGNNLALCARRTQRLEELRTELLTAHPNIDVQIAALDVTDEQQVHDVFTSFAAHFGSFERMIINAGIGEGAPIGVGTPAPNRATMITNVLGTLAQAESALEILRKQSRGHLVFVSSFAAVRGMRRSMAAYSASKAAVTTLAEGIRMERIPGLDVTILCPGFIATDINAGGKGMPFVVDVQTGVTAMVRAIEARKRLAYIPTWPWALLARLFRILPDGILRRLT